MKIYFKRSICLIIALVLAFLFASCNETETPYNTTTVHSCFTTQATNRYPPGYSPNPSRTEYEIKVVDGKYYIDYDDIAYYLDYDLGIIETAGFKSVEEFKLRLDTNELFPYQIAQITYYAKDKTDPLLIIDLNDFYVPKWPPYVSTRGMGYYNFSKYGYASHPISSCTDCRNISIVAIVKIPKEDYEKGLQEYQSRSTNEEWTCKFLENGNKRLYVSTIKSDHSDDHIECYVYGEENGLYFEIEVSGPKDLLTDEFICSIGMEKYEYVP